MTLQETFDKVIDELKSDGIKYLEDDGSFDPVPIAPWLLREINYWDGDEDVKKDLIDLTISYASQAFEKISGLKAPMNFEVMADFNKYWRENHVACKVDRGIIRPVFMTLRDALNKK